MSTPQEPTEIDNSAPPSIILILQEFEYPRIKRARKHNLTDMLFIALCTVICGGESFEDMEEFGKSVSSVILSEVSFPNSV